MRLVCFVVCLTGQFNGIPPEERLAHTACFIELPEEEGGNRVVILGGAGTQAYFGDVHVLRTSDPNLYTWEIPDVSALIRNRGSRLRMRPGLIGACSWTGDQSLRYG